MTEPFEQSEMQSVPSGSFGRLSDPETLWRAYLRYRAGKLRLPAVARFDLDADLSVLDLSDDLRQGRYQPGAYVLKVIRDPKTRLIAAAPVIDRVVHQALVGELAPHYDRSFIHDNYASQTGRGPHRAVLRYLAWTRSYSFRWSLDVRRYFPSINHELLCGLLFRRLRDERTRALIRLILLEGGRIYQTELARKVMQLDDNPIAPGCGLPIGSYVSQWCGTLYLDGLDHFVKRVLKIPGYLRYMDDLVLFAEDPDALTKARSAPSTFLGYRVSRAGIRAGPKLKRRMARRLRRAAQRGPVALARSLRSYAGLVLF